MHVVIPGNGVRSIPAKNDSSSVIIVDDVFFKPYIVAIQRTDYGSAIIIIHDVIPNYHVMSTCVRIYTVMSAVMYLVVLDNHVAHVHRIKSKIQMVKIIVPYYAAMASIILQPGVILPHPASYPMYPMYELVIFVVPAAPLSILIYGLGAPWWVSLSFTAIGQLLPHNAVAGPELSLDPLLIA